MPDIIKKRTFHTYTFKNYFITWSSDHFTFSNLIQLHILKLSKYLPYMGRKFLSPVSHTQIQSNMLNCMTIEPEQYSLWSIMYCT